jgi:signal transduction histidine kinase
MSLRGRLLLAQAPLGLALVFLGLVAIYSVSQLGEQSAMILAENYNSVKAAEQMKESIERIDSGAIFFATGRREKALTQIDEHRKRFAAALAVEGDNLTEPHEPEKFKTLCDSWKNYQQKLDRFLKLSSTKELQEMYFREMEPGFLAVKKAANDILDLNQDAMWAKSERAKRLAQRTNATMLATALGALLGGLALSTTLTRRMLRPLSVLTQAVGRLGAGDFEARANVPGSDEIAALAHHFNAMAEHLSDYRASSLGELILAQQAAQAAIDSIPDPTMIFEAQGDALRTNRAAEQLLEAAKPPPGGDPSAGARAKLNSLLEQLRTHVLQGKGAVMPQGFDEAVSLALGDGERFFLPRATPVYDDQGTITGATVIFQDVTRLRTFDQLKNDLVATVAHEFRTPLTSLRMSIHLCIEGVPGSLTEKQADLLYTAREDCQRLQGIVDELLDFARIQSGRVDVHPRPVAASALVATALAAHRAAAAAKEVQLREDPLLTSAKVLADPERVQLVFSNLIGNAIRHTPRDGSVEVRAREVDNMVRFEVADSGEGIAKEYQQAIFQRFFQIPGTAGGAGLGLFISKEIVEAQGGAIGLQSEPGQGAVFWFTLPLAKDASVPSPSGRGLA